LLHASAALGTVRVTFETIPQLLHHASATLGTVMVTFETIPQFQLLRLAFVFETKMVVLLTRGCNLFCMPSENDLTTEVSKKMAHVPLSNRLTQRKHNCCTYTWIFNSMIMPVA
jgi:hypothetical protein